MPDRHDWERESHHLASNCKERRIVLTPEVALDTKAKSFASQEKNVPNALLICVGG